MTDNAPSQSASAADETVAPQPPNEEDLDQLDYSNPSVCQAYKAWHDSCFYRWYTDEFLPGIAKDPKPCDEEWVLYQKCVTRRINASDLDPDSLVIRQIPFERT